MFWPCAFYVANMRFRYNDRDIFKHRWSRCFLTNRMLWKTACMLFGLHDQDLGGLTTFSRTQIAANHQ